MGRALLIFPDENSLQLVSAVADYDLPLADIVELQEEALLETGNILLNCCIATIANLLHRTLKMSLPSLVRGDADEILAVNGLSEGDPTLFLCIDFRVNERAITGYLAFMMPMPALGDLKRLLNEFIQRVT